MKQLNLITTEGRQSFYNSTKWRALRDYKISLQPLCEECLKKNRLKPATEVHHIKDISDCPTFENALNYEGLLSLCKSCHSSITKQKRAPIWKPFNLKDFVAKHE